MLSRTGSEDPVESFRDFLLSTYRPQVDQLIAEERRSIVIDFKDLYLFNESLAKQVLESPTKVIPDMEKIAYSVLEGIDPEYTSGFKFFHVRFKDIPTILSIRDIKSFHVNKLISFEGVVVRASTVESLLQIGLFECNYCHHRMLVEQEGVFLTFPPKCENPGCKYGGIAKPSNFTFIPEESIFVDVQQLRVQERPEDLPAGQFPRTLDFQVLDDLVDRVRPGDRVSVVGIVKNVIQFTGRFRIRRRFKIGIECNNIEPLTGWEDTPLTQDEIQVIKEMSKDPNIYDRIVDSIAPSLYGETIRVIKEAVALQLVGGVAKEFPDGVRVRGDINILLVGDPGTGKSQLLKYVQRVAPRGLYTSGRGTTAAGLTAAAVRDRLTGGFVLEAGALVLADKGVAAIDEFEKMRPEDRVAIHEAMEQQTISIAKGGIVATLNARTAILAAANPSGGRYDDTREFSENIDLSPTILSRFDAIFLLRDKPDPERDSQLAQHILDYHRGVGVASAGMLSPEVLKSYLSYARNLSPVLTEEAAERIKEFFLEMRRKSVGSITITPRQLESIIRLAEAKAKIHLRSEIKVEDVETAIRITDFWLNQVARSIEGYQDIDIIMSGKSAPTRERMSIIRDVIRELSIGKPNGANLDLVRENVMERLGIDETEFNRLISILRKEGIIFFPTTGMVKLVGKK
ncbi:MAG TPA: minichromosome maintenance protein MCM [Candidatus Bathyarchaeota archaeon]|nr:minichromosome maintenance protein MCM [Candidatus Bathyarchaeota archaeon]